MSKGFIVNLGVVLGFGHDGPGTKIESMKRGNEFVTSASDPSRYAALFAEMQNPTPPPLPDVDDIVLTNSAKIEMLLTRFPPTPVDERAQRQRMRDRGEA